MELAIMIVAAVLPAVLLVCVIYRKDTMRPEPIKQIFKACGWGVISALLTLTVTTPLQAIWGEGTGVGIIDSAFDAFMLAAVPEEFAKFACLFMFLRKNRYYDEYIDGIVYAACVGMGFAGFENILYLINAETWGTLAVTRALISVPGHYAFALLMGYYFSYWRLGGDKRSGILMLAAPIIAHGIFDYLLMVMPHLEVISGIILILFVIFLKKMHSYASKLVATHILYDKYNTFHGKEEVQQNCTETEVVGCSMENVKGKAGVFALICSFLFPIIGFICYARQRENVKNPKTYLYAAIAGMVVNLITTW